jgi:hypothetical protein
MIYFMKSTAGQVGRYLMGAAITGAVGYLGTTAAVHPAPPIWPYLIFLGGFATGALLHLTAQRQDAIATKSTDAAAVGVAQPVTVPGGGAIPQGGSISWPNPDAIKTSEDYKSVLRRTWISAGAPDMAEIRRRTGGLLDGKRLDELIHGRVYFFRAEDFRDSLLILDSFELPESLIQKWKEAEARVRIQVRYPHWRVTVVNVSLLGLVLFCAVGSAAAELSAPPRLGTGNWLAIGVSSLALVIAGLMALAGFEGSLPDSDIVSAAALNFAYLMLAAFCVGGLLAGWLLTKHHIGIENVNHYMAHVGYDIRNWLAWRF